MLVLQVAEDPGYLRFPTIAGDRIAFIAEDDLWTVAAGGGVARRLTTALSAVSMPCLRPDGGAIAFVAQEDGPAEAYVVDGEGGQPRQLTHFCASTVTVGWSPDGRVVVCSDARAPFGGLREAFLVAPEGGEPERLPWGPAQRIALSPNGGMVIGRNVGDPSRWKRYRGGTAGEFWVDADGSGDFIRWSALKGNLASPMWLGPRVYFLSDHEGVGNLYSALPDGSDVRRHTEHADYYARNAQTDGRRIVYHAGGDLYVFDPASGARRVDVQLRSQRAQRARRFVDAGRYLDGVDIHPKGHALLVTTRGHAFAFGHWEGPVLPAGEEHGVRYRLPRWLPDGRRMVAIADSGGEEALEVHPLAVPTAGAEIDVVLAGAPATRVQADVGRAVAIAVCPVGARLAITNHRNELLVVDVDTGTTALVERNDFGEITGPAWSPDGGWLCYAAPLSRKTTALRLVRVEDDAGSAAPAGGDVGADAGAGGDASGATPSVRVGEPVTITKPVLWDHAPAFDPEGRYLYFLSHRTFDPVYDNLQFDLGFPRGVRPYLITLRADDPSPFLPRPRPLVEEGGGGDRGEDPGDGAHGDDKPGAEDDGADHGDGEAERGDRSGAASRAAGTGGGGKGDGKAGKPPLRIDLDGIEERICAFPVPEGRYRRIAAVRGKALFASWPVEGSIGDPQAQSREVRDKGVLEWFDLKELRREPMAGEITDFWLSLDRRVLAYRSGDRLRVLAAGKKPGPEARDGGSDRRSGWIDWKRLHVAVEPGREWAQMLREAWRLQRDNFWTADMSGVDWDLVWERYCRLLPRVTTRAELSDLMWEMQGELGTSHAYEMGGDYRRGPGYGQGLLGADVVWDAAAGGGRIERVVRGDPWMEGADSPLRAPGVGVHDGDIIHAVDGRPVSERVPLGSLLVGKGGTEVALTVGGALSSDGPDAPPRRTVVVKALRSERTLRYRDWVEANRRLVHTESGGRIGYIHIPDMGPRGYAEFHRAWLAEAERDGLVVDVRHNGGGHVSQLILEKLARRPVGYDVPRWSPPEPYPAEAVPGPIVALCDELAGSDGDIFSHCFKLMKLGPLVGKRTWGGVIGISVRHALVDGTHTSQPEFSFWFSDVGWGVENYGTDPDIPVENRPQDHRDGTDPQLRRALDEALAWLQERPVVRPRFDGRPSRALPRGLGGWGG